MERKLTYNEKNKVNEICKNRMIIGIAYGNIAKIIASIFIILFFLFLYFEIALGSIWIYLGIGILTSIAVIIGITYMQAPYVSIKDNTCSCIETKMLSKRKVLIEDPQNFIPYSILEKTVKLGEERCYYYYVTVNIGGKLKEVEYIGREFDYLVIGEEMLIIEFKSKIKKGIKYICFSNKEING